MFVFLLAALSSAFPLHAQDGGSSDLAPTPSTADIDTVIAAVKERPVSLSMRGKSVEVIAQLDNIDGCSAKMTANAPGNSRKWSRRIDWADLAWTGRTEGDRVTAVFFEPEARLAGDTIVFLVDRPAEFRAAIGRLRRICRERATPLQSVAFGPGGSMRNCYLSRMPELHLIETPDNPKLPPRASLTVLSRESPTAELNLLAERPNPQGKVGAAEWARPLVAFVIADGKLGSMPVSVARFALDGEGAVTVQSLAAYGDTRVRITMDPFSDRPSKGGAAAFYPRLARSVIVTMSLTGADGQPRGTYSFEAGPLLAVAQKMLSDMSWSCARADTPKPPATAWRQ